MTKLRELVYRYAIGMVVLLAAIITFLVYKAGTIQVIMNNQSTMMNIAVTLAGFLFTGQGIILTLSPENKFIKLVKKVGYMKDFNNLCRRAEVLFVVSILLGIDIWNSQALDFAYFFCFICALLFATWALTLFSNLVKYYIRSDT